MSAVSANYLRTSSLKPIAHAIAVMLMTAALTPVAAQSTPPAEPKPADTTKQPETKPLEPKSKPVSAAVTGANDPTKLESIVVTAGKRVELLENVPGAISVISSEQLERQNVRSLEDAITLTPAVTVTYGTTAANNGLNMRGIGTSSIGIGVESDVAVIVDDIPLGTQFQAFRDLTDVLRIEVLKGPQSTLVGKNAIAGAISITTKPVTGLLRGEVSTLFTSDREQRFRVTYGGDISETVGLRIAASANDFPGNVNNLTTGSKINGSRGKTVLAKLVWRPNDRLNVEFSPRYNVNDSSCCALVATSFTPLQGALLSNTAQLPATQLLAGITPGPNNRNIRNDVDTGIESTTYGGGLRANYVFANEMQLTSITSTEHYKASDTRDQDFVDANTLLYYPLANGRPAGVAQGYVQSGDYDIKSQTQEFRLSSPDTGNFKYVAGLWYGKNDIDRQFTRGYNGIALTTPVRYFANTYNVNKAIFGQASWEFAPSYTLTAGGRFNQQESGYWLKKGSPPPAEFVTTEYYESIGNKENATTGKLSLQHQFAEGLMGYVLGSTGYKGQAYDVTSGLNAATAAQQPVPSEKAKNFEIGFKGTFFDNRMTLNLAAFSAKFKNYQQNSGSYLPGTTTFVTRLNSIGGVETKGVEVDLAALLTSQFLLNASVAYTEATVSDWPNAPCYNVGGSPNGGFNLACRLRVPEFGNTNVQDLKGAPMPNAPKWKASISGKYDIPLNGVGFDAFINASARYQTKVITNINQDPSLSAPAYGVVNLGFGIADKGKRFTLSFLVNNVLDKPYANTGFTGLGSWSSRAPNPVVNVATSTWTPARDAFRYYGIRVDLKF
jgi:iron complex outermembrane recepter protein